jgi:hypothetical protein
VKEVILLEMCPWWGSSDPSLSFLFYFLAVKRWIDLLCQALLPWCIMLPEGPKQQGQATMDWNSAFKLFLSGICHSHGKLTNTLSLIYYHCLSAHCTLYGLGTSKKKGPTSFLFLLYCQKPARCGAFTEHLAPDSWRTISKPYTQFVSSIKM